MIGVGAGWPGSHLLLDADTGVSRGTCDRDRLCAGTGGKVPKSPEKSKSENFLTF